jgi:hypothetical protein
VRCVVSLGHYTSGVRTYCWRCPRDRVGQ